MLTCWKSRRECGLEKMFFSLSSDSIGFKIIFISLFLYFLVISPLKKNTKYQKVNVFYLIFVFVFILKKKKFVTTNTIPSTEQHLCCLKANDVVLHPFFSFAHIIFFFFYFFTLKIILIPVFFQCLSF